MSRLFSSRIMPSLYGSTASPRCSQRVLVTKEKLPRLAKVPGSLGAKAALAVGMVFSRDCACSPRPSAAVFQASSSAFELLPISPVIILLAALIQSELSHVAIAIYAAWPWKQRGMGRNSMGCTLRNAGRTSFKPKKILLHFYLTVRRSLFAWMHFPPSGQPKPAECD